MKPSGSGSGTEQNLQCTIWQIQLRWHDYYGSLIDHSQLLGEGWAGWAPDRRGTAVWHLLGTDWDVAAWFQLEEPAHSQAGSAKGSTTLLLFLCLKYVFQYNSLCRLFIGFFSSHHLLVLPQMYAGAGNLFISVGQRTDFPTMMHFSFLYSCVGKA